MREVDGFVDASALLRSGVYALLRKGEVVYIGKAKVMLTRVCSHRRAWSDKRQKAKELPSWFPIKGILFDEVRVRPVPLEQLDEVEREMIARYRPRFNTLLKPKLPLAGMVIAGHRIAATPMERRI